MSRLNRVMREKDDAIQNRGKKKKDIPVYDLKGNVITPEKKKKEKRLGIVLLVFAGIVALLYFPGLFMKDKNSQPTPVVSIKYESIKKSTDYLKSHANEDFDMDGIINSEEQQFKMNPWNIDTDHDCLTDSCELNYSHTDPIVSDSEFLINAQKKQDKENNKKLGSPYRIRNVTLWANDYTSKALGSVVETPYGYRFCGFEGYAQFPKESGQYAYRIVNGVHSPLKYREKEKVWQIHSNDEVELFDKPLQETVEFSLFGHPFYAPDNIVLKAISKILPDKGFLTSQVKMKIDIEPDTSDNVTAEIDTPVFRENNEFRFGKNNNSLNDLNYVRESIKKGSCIAVSLYNANEGEYTGVIYGYDSKGNFLLADQDSLKPIGKLIIKETAYKMMNEKGEIVSISYFDFGGVYFRNSNNEYQMFSSLNGDHISFYAASVGDSTGSQLLEDHLKDVVDDTEEKPETVGNDALEKEQQLQQEQEMEEGNISDKPITLDNTVEEEAEEASTEATTQAPAKATTQAPEETTTQATDEGVEEITTNN